MKVVELIETTEWDNQDSDLPFLYKKYRSAINAFSITLHDTFHKNPKLDLSSIKTLVQAIRVLDAWVKRQAITDHPVALAGCRLDEKIFAQFPTLERKWKYIINLTTKITEMGGSFDITVS